MELYDSETMNLRRNELLELFKENIYLIVANEERILSDERLSRVEVPTHIGNCYYGVLYSFTLGNFLRLWRTCKSAVIFDENNEMEFVYACSGGVSGGACWFANRDGVDRIRAGAFPSKYYADVFDTVFKMSSVIYSDKTWDRFSGSYQPKPYELDEAIEKLLITTINPYAINLEEYKQQILLSHKINKQTTIPVTYMKNWKPVTLNLHDRHGDIRLKITDRTTESDVTDFFYRYDYIKLTVKLTEAGKSICNILGMNPSNMENEDAMKANIIANIVMNEVAGLIWYFDLDDLDPSKLEHLEIHGLEEEVIEDLKQFCESLFRESIRYLKKTEKFGYEFPPF